MMLLNIIAVVYCAHAFLLYVTDHQDVFNLPDRLNRQCRVLSRVFMYLSIALLFVYYICTIIWRITL